MSDEDEEEQDDEDDELADLVEEALLKYARS